jgi:hypothetical protein
MILGFEGFQRVLILQNYGISEPPVGDEGNLAWMCAFLIANFGDSKFL